MQLEQRTLLHALTGRLLAASLLLTGVSLTTGCEEGAFEDAGEEIDDGMDDAADNLEDAADDFEDAADDALDNP